MTLSLDLDVVGLMLLVVGVYTFIWALDTRRGKLPSETAAVAFMVGAFTAGMGVAFFLAGVFGR